VNPDIADGAYVARFLNSPFAKREIERFTFGVTRPKVTLREFKALAVPLPPLPEQKRIAGILDKADALRRKRQQALQLTDQFLRSTFLDIFGDPVTNPRNWTMLRLDDVSTRITDGEHLNPEFTPEGVPMVMAANVLSRGVNFDGVRFVSEGDHERFSKKCNPEFDDLLIVSRGATIGRCTLVDVNRRFSLMGSVILVKPDQTKIVAAYLEALLSHPGYYQRLFTTSSASAQQAIYISHLKEMQIPRPPVALQRRFDVVFRRTETSAEHHGQFHEAVDYLFHSLVQRAFRGEL
jgi:type I restriction enzyme S subunit